MKNCFWFLFTGLLLILNPVKSQNSQLFIPLEIQKAYASGTRSLDGKPGSSYWQNTADYKIEVTLISSEKSIQGIEEVRYFNNSPDDLESLVVHLYQDVYKEGNIRQFPISPEDINEGVELTGIFIDDVPYNVQDPKVARRNGTTIVFKLQKPLKSKSSLIFKASWKLKIPEVSTFRTGVFDSSSFFIAYWYPQIAVYDDIYGWDLMDYNIRTEFYNNLANFDVTVFAPPNFVVWATGMLNNPEEVLPKELFNRYTKARSLPEALHIITAADIKKGFRSPKAKWHFKASGVTDFAFAASDHHIWDATTFTVNDHKIFISSVLPLNSSDNITEHLNMQQKALQHFSVDLPGITYPYEAFTTFVTKDGGGMEYPMMALNGGTDRRTTLHEMFHTYFPMYVRINERRWAWMDEGITNYNTLIVGKRYFENDQDLIHVFNTTLGSMGTSGDVPLMTPSQYLIDPYYRYSSYQEPETVYAILHHFLGEEMFTLCYREYIQRWAKKAPTPYDFFFTIENISGKDLKWLWKPWFFEFGVADLSIHSFEKGKLSVINHGIKPVPVFIEAEYKDGTIKKLTEKAFVWANGQKTLEFVLEDYEKIERIALNRMVTDANPEDNFYPSIESFYKGNKLNNGILGNYVMDRYGTSISISDEGGLYYIKLPRMNITMIIYPEDALHYSSLDGSMKIAFGESFKSMFIDWNGNFSASRVE